jgi:hypothetical protein
MYSERDALASGSLGVVSLAGVCRCWPEARRASGNKQVRHCRLSVLGWLADPIDDGVYGPREERVVDGPAGEQPA